MITWQLKLINKQYVWVCGNCNAAIVIEKLDEANSDEMKKLKEEHLAQCTGLVNSEK